MGTDLTDIESMDQLGMVMLPAPVQLHTGLSGSWVVGLMRRVRPLQTTRPMGTGTLLLVLRAGMSLTEVGRFGKMMVEGTCIIKFNV
jgi:hypothetical protein